MATNITKGDLATKQALYATKMIQMLKEDEGDKLTKYAETVEGEGGKAEFYRILEVSDTFTHGDIKDSDGTAGKPMNLYANDGFAATEESFEVDMVELTSGENISKQKVASTKLGVSSAILNKHVRNLNRQKDALIIKAINAVKADTNYTTKITEVALTGTIEDDAVVKKILSNVAYAVANSESSDNHRASVAVLINSKDHAKLYENEIFTSSDFAGMVNKGGMKNVFNAEFIAYKGSALVPEGTIKIIPSDTIGVGITSGGEDASLDWAPGIRKYQATAAITRAAAVLDPEAIIEIKVKAKP